ncbi:MAG: Ig-like domain-containing protein [Prolixibacteraceae bacterium]|nr:Ig-like domain-containing protein [Prolixibacteraceae bacterium]
MRLNLLLLSKARSLVVFLFFFLIFTVNTKSTTAQNARISIDKDDYAPGETVHITGTGWTSDDVVTLQVFNKTNPFLNSTEHYLSWNIKPVNGNFTAIWEVSQSELNTALILSAEGKVSGLKYNISFTDANNLTISGFVKLADGTPVQGATITVYTNAALTNVDATTTSATDGTWSFSLIKSPTRYLVVTPPTCYSSTSVFLGSNPGSISSISNNEIVVDGGANGGSSTGNIFYLTGNTITAPSGTTFCATSASSDVTLIGSDMGSGASYQWQINTNANDLDNTYSYTNISGATLKDFNPGTITATKGYRRIVAGTCPSSSNVVKLFVTPAITGNTISASTPTVNCGSFYANYINGSNPSGGNNNTFTFQWQSSTDGLNFTNITGETGQHYYFPGGNVISSIYFRRIVYSGYCTSYSNVLFYNTKAAVISGNLTVNVGSTTQLTGSPSGGTWSSGTTSVATVNSSGLVSGVSGGTSIITYTTTTGCINSATVSVTGSSCTNVGITSATAAASPICSNETTTLTANGVVGTNALVTWWSATGGSGTNYGTGLTLANASPGNYYARVTGDCGAPVEALVTVISNPNASIGSVFGASQLCIGETTTYSTNTVVLGGGTGAWSTSDATIATVDASGLVIGVANGSCDIIYTITGGCGGTQTARQSLTVESPGDPAVFGSGQWNVYVYNGANSNLSSNTYRGYYSDSNLSFDTRNMWLANSTPSSATGYQGCSVDKLMTFVYKRKGFPCGLYTISVGHDDDASLLINGGDTWSAANWTYTPVAVPGNYFLDENSTVELRVRNTGGGDAYGQLGFSSSSNLTITPVVNSPICSSSNSISGTSEANATIVVYTSGTQIGSTISNSSGQWSVAVSSLSAGDEITATAKVDNKCLSNVSSSVTVVPTNTFDLASSTPLLCINTSLTPITITTTGATGIGTAIGLPRGVTATWNSNQITISGTPTTSGTFNYSIPLTGGCGMVSATGTITVIPLPVAFTVTGGGTYCSGGSGVAVGLSGSEIGVTYHLYENGVSTGSSVSGTGDAISFGNQLAGTYTVVATISNGDCPAQMTGSAVVTIGDTEKPAITKCLPGGEADCVKNLPAAITTIQGFIDAGGEVTDNCTAPMTVSYNDVITPGSPCEVRRTYTITDASGNKATCTQVFTITDTEAPVINSVDNLVFPPTNESCGAELTINIPTKVYENCGFVEQGAHFEYNIAGTPKTGNGSISDTFPEGTTLITWTITDLCGHVSGPKTQSVEVAFGITPISYDNGSIATGAGSGIQPMQTSTHEYFVDDKVPDSEYTYTWGLFEDDGVTAVNSSLYTKTSVNAAHIKISFTTISTGNYILSVIKTKPGITCEKQVTRSIALQSNSSFDVVLDNLGNQCQAPSGNLTTISWNVTFPNVITEPFMFSYSIKLGGTVVASGNVANITYGGAIPTSGLSAGAQTSKSANSNAVVIYYSLYRVSGSDLERKVEIEINATDAYQVSEPNRTNNIDDLKINQVPVITFE